MIRLPLNGSPVEIVTASTGWANMVDNMVKKITKERHTPLGTSKPRHRVINSSSFKWYVMVVLG
ncbi:hypothetical protein SBDP1_440015 [Syntrophobacter sp. SbD1]|nr:hypothetical protein SBDP1_440015 [Syntrophobacter sp. SbD1]